MEGEVKQEITEEPFDLPRKNANIQKSEVPKNVSVIDLSSSSDDSDDSDDDSAFLRKRSGVFDGTDLDNHKKRKFDDSGVVLPLGFLDPLPLDEPFQLPAPETETLSPVSQETVQVPPLQPPAAAIQGCRQFWKAGDFEGDQIVRTETVSGGMDHVRVHPRFLHSNATSHKWSLGAFAELLDNSLDEVCHGATYVNIDMLANKKDGTRMLLVEDNGGGMDPDKMRQCMSLGYSAKSKLANTIGQYGNGFKTSTMRLGADVIVLTRCRGLDGKSPTQSIGMLSYTFLRGTGKEDIVVPMIDYENGGEGWNQLIRTSPADWKTNVETIVHWSPYSSEADLLHQFNYIKDQGTRIIIYNIWEDDQGELELDFDADPYDIQIRGANRDTKNIEMAKMFPNSMHFLTYRHSLRSYASILYLRLPRGFKIILRGKEVQHHNIVNDMMLKQEITYRPQPGADGAPKNANMVAVVKIGFVKDAKDHIDVQGFNVYHKNRLIKPFWRVWNAAGSDGRGVIGVLEANFVEPAHDKQGFERTTVLQRLETKLVQMQKTYWSTNCHKIGYAPRVNKKQFNGSIPAKETPASKKAVSPSNVTPRISSSPDPPYHPDTDKRQTHSNLKHIERRDALHVASSVPADDTRVYGHASIGAGLDSRNVIKRSEKKITSSPLVNGQASISAGLDSKNIIKRSEKKMSSSPHVNGHASVSPGLGSKNIIERSEKITSSSPQCLLNESSHEIQYNESSHEIQYNTQSSPDLDDAQLDVSGEGSDQICTREQAKTMVEEHDISANEPGPSESGSYSLKQLVQENQERKDRLKNLEETLEFERDKVKSLEAQLLEAEQKLEAASSEQEALIDIFSEERNRRDKEEEILRKKLKDASTTIQELIEKQRSAL